MNLKNLLTMLCGLLEGANAYLSFVPYHGLFAAAAVFLRAVIDQFWPAQSNVPTQG